MLKITTWSLKTPDGYSFNHLEDGHSADSTPKPKHENHKGWKNQTWRKDLAYLVGDVEPLKVIYHETKPVAKELPPYVRSLH